MADDSRTDDVISLRTGPVPRSGAQTGLCSARPVHHELLDQRLHKMSVTVARAHTRIGSHAAFRELT